MQSQKVMGLEGERGVSSTTVVAEFHLESLWTEHLHNRTHLSADQPGFG